MGLIMSDQFTEDAGVADMKINHSLRIIDRDSDITCAQYVLIVLYILYEKDCFLAMIDFLCFRK